MVVTVVDSQIKVTKFQVFGVGFDIPYSFYTLGILSDESIIAMEKYITETMSVDKFVGHYECVVNFCRSNNIPLCQLSI